MISRATKVQQLAWRGTRPSIVQSVREVLGRAVRETGQALDRSGQLLESYTWLPDKYIGGDPPVKYQDFLSRHRQKMPMLHCGRPVVHPDVAFLAPCATLIGSVRVEEGASVWYGAILRADACYNANSFNQSDEEILKLEKQSVLQLEDGSDADAEKAEEDLDEDELEELAAIKRQRMLRTLSDKRKDVYSAGGGIYVGKDTNLQDGVIVTARESSTVLGQGVTVGHQAQLHSTTVEDFALVGMGSILSEGSHVESEALVAAGAVVPPNVRIAAGELWVGNPARKIRDLTAAEREKLHYQSSEYVQVALTHPMELGGNLTFPWEEALLEQMENETDVHEQIAEMNKWNNTVYGYLTRPEKDTSTKLDAGDEKEVKQVDAGVGEISDRESRDEELNKSHATAKIEATR